MKLESVWQGETKKYPGLEKDIDCDIAVIGGGIAGYLTAFKLAEAGRKVTLLEADRLFSGTTGRTTAKISANQGSVYAELSARYGQRAAKRQPGCGLIGDVISPFSRMRLRGACTSGTGIADSSAFVYG